MNYFIHQGGETYGPYTIGQLRSMWSTGQVTGETLYCEEGGENWLHLRVLETDLDPPKASPPPIPSPPARRTSALRLIFVIAGLFLAALALIALVGTLGRSNDDTVSEAYANMINAFAEKHDMTVEETARWQYVLTHRSLTLADFDQALTKLGQSRDRAVGHHVEVVRKNLGGRRLVPGEAKFPQNPVITGEEESMVKLLKAAGY
jgi:hypothetical protein